VGISIIHKSRQKRQITVLGTWEDKSSFRNNSSIEEASFQRAEWTGAKRIPISYYVVGDYCKRTVAYISSTCSISYIYT
jgi:hypothetical protein